MVALAACSGEEVQVASEESDLIYQDDFSTGQVGQWITEGDELGSTAVSDGSLIIDINAPNAMQYTTLEEPTFADFTLDVSGTLLEGSQDSTYGVLFRMQSPSQFYRFEVKGDGRYMIERLDGDGGWTRFVDDWLVSEAIQVGPNATNRLRIIADGPEMAFYVNGELLQEIGDERYSAGNIGLDAGTFGQTRTRVAFDDLSVALP